MFDAIMAIALLATPFAVWLGIATFMRRRGRGVALRHASGIVAGFAAFVLVGTVFVATGLITPKPPTVAALPAAPVAEVAEIAPAPLAPAPIAAKPQNEWEAMGIQPIDAPVSIAPPKQPDADRAESPIEAERTRRGRLAYVVASAVKENLNNPRSFELVRARVTAKGAVCLRYRATNGFNATVLAETNVDPLGKVKPTDALCNGKDGSMDTTWVQTLL